MLPYNWGRWYTRGFIVLPYNWGMVYQRCYSVNGGYKYGGIAEKPPNVTRHYFSILSVI